MAVIMKGLLVGAITASGISLAVAGGVAAVVGAGVGEEPASEESAVSEESAA